MKTLLFCASETLGWYVFAKNGIVKVPPVFHGILKVFSFAVGLFQSG